MPERTTNGPGDGAGVEAGSRAGRGADDVAPFAAGAEPGDDGGLSSPGADGGHGGSDISRALSPLREVVASLSAASAGAVPSSVDRRRLVRRVRAAGSSALPALLRALTTGQPGEAAWAAWLLERVGGAERPRVVERVSRVLEDPRLTEEQHQRAEALLRRLQLPAAREVDVAQPPGSPSRRELLDEDLRMIQALDDHLADAAPPEVRAARRINHRRDARNLGVDLVERGELARARGVLMSAVAADPDDIEALSYLGVCLLQLNEPDRALLYLERTGNLEPDEAVHHWNVAAAARAAARPCRAYRALRRYLELVDDHGGSEGRRAEAERFVASYHGAIAGMHPGVDLATVQRGEDLFARAYIDLAAQRYELAAAVLREVVAMLPQHYPSWGNLGAAELALGNQEEALRCLRRALDLKPDYDIARDNLRIIETRH